MVDLGTFRLIRRSSEESTWSSVQLALQGNEVSVYIRACTIFAYNSCTLIWKRGRTTKCKFSAWKVTAKKMVCKFGCHERGNLQRSFSNERWTEAETKSDSQAGSLMNVAEFKAAFMGKLYYY